jgi:hypothetical protein
VHRDVRVAAGERFLQLLHEETFAADRGERSTQPAIAFGRHAADLDLDAGMELCEA